ncbi:MAG: sulfite reductase subunit C, partial [Lachnospiraceae bacterium]|nr:sulfite reductase subunit C [Lachnospiraceae bacterium]
MSLDINTKKAKKNAWRISKERGMGASRIRIPGGYCDADILGLVQEIAKEYGNGYVHLTTRQGFEIEGIHLEDMEAVNKKLQPIIEKSGVNQNPEDKDNGYTASGTRNVSACIGNNVCPFA